MLPFVRESLSIHSRFLVIQLTGMSILIVVIFLLYPNSSEKENRLDIRLKFLQKSCKIQRIRMQENLFLHCAALSKPTTNSR